MLWLAPLLVVVAGHGLIVPAFHEKHLVNEVLKVNISIGDNHNDLTLIAVPNQNLISLKESNDTKCLGDCKNFWKLQSKEHTKMYKKDQTILSSAPFIVHENIVINESLLPQVPFSMKNDTYDLLTFGYGLWNLLTSAMAEYWFLGYLMEKGIISEPQYLLISNGSNWQFIFGGIDHAKVEGELKKMKIKEYSPLSRYQSNFVRSDIIGTVILDKFAIKTDKKIKMDLYENSTLSLMYNYGDADFAVPHDVYKQILKTFKLEEGNQGLVGKCVDNLTSFFFEFDGEEINVPMKAVQTHVGTQCHFSIHGMPGNQYDFYVGPQILRHIYALFDAEDFTVSLGQYRELNSSAIEFFGEPGSQSTTVPLQSGDKKNASPKMLPSMSLFLIAAMFVI